MNQGNKEEVEQIEQVVVPDIIGKTISESEKILKENSLQISIENNSEDLDKENAIVKEQTPKPGITVNAGNNVYIKYN